MQKDGYRLGGEESGHIIFSKYASTGDGIITAIKIMEVLIDSKHPASKLCDGFERFPQLLKNVRVESKPAVIADDDVQAAVKNAQESLGDDGRVLLRQSGTEPVIRVMVEAKGEEICRKHVNDIVKVIEQKGHVVQ